MMNLKTGIAPVLAEQYADMLSLDFRRRNGLLESYHHNTDDLVKWDKRLQTYIGGLLYLKDDACAYLESQLESPLSCGDVFAIGTFSSHSGNYRLLEGCMGLIQAMPHLLSAVEPLVAWSASKSSFLDLTIFSPVVGVIAAYQTGVASQMPVLTNIEISRLTTLPIAIPGLIYVLYHQQHPDYFSLISQLANSSDVQISLGVMKAILERNLPYRDISIELLLIRLIECSSGKVRERAVMLYLLNTDYVTVNCLNLLSQKSSDKRLYLKALGMSGIPENISILSEYLESPEYARLSAASIVMITGRSLEQAGWKSEISLLSSTYHNDQHDIIPVNESDEALSWPDKTAFQRWWNINSSNFDKSSPYIGGYPVTVAGLKTVLHQGLLALHPLAVARLQYLKQEVSSLSTPSFLRKPRW